MLMKAPKLWAAMMGIGGRWRDMFGGRINQELGEVDKQGFGRESKL